MHTVPEISTNCKPRPRYYAHYGDMDGTAELIAYGDIIFRPTDVWQRIRLIKADTADLVLHGRTDLVEAQRQADQARGGFAAMVCNHNGRR